MSATYHVYRHLSGGRDARFRMRESVAPVLGPRGRPLAFEDLDAAVAMANRMTRGNSRVGSDHCANVRFTAGWQGECA